VAVLSDLGTLTVLMLVGAAFAAGWVDAVVGGGGLIQLPALLLGLGGQFPVVTALATNKVSSLCGTSTSSVAYYRRVHPDLRTALPMAGLALTGSVGGALVASHIPSAVFKPVILLLLVVVAIYTWRRPLLGSAEKLRFDGRAHHLAAGLAGLVIGFYDGMAGPGTGSFLVFTLVGLLGYAFLEASAKAKIANVATNVGALIVFVPQHAVLWTLGLLMGLANLGGGLLGTWTAVARGSSFVRVVFLLVVGALILRLGYDVVTELAG
jgi:uncharacterized protein